MVLCHSRSKGGVAWVGCMVKSTLLSRLRAILLSEWRCAIASIEGRDRAVNRLWLQGQFMGMAGDGISRKVQEGV
jgi:hypothetical protein